MTILTPIIAFAGKLSAGLIALIQLLLGVAGIPAGTAAAAAAQNPYIVTGGSAWVSAHRQGAEEAPENTLMAVEQCVNAASYRANILEMDVQLTKDGQLVLLHDNTFDATSNAVEAFGHSNIVPIFHDYAELYANLNMGSGWDAPWAALRGSEIPAGLRVTKMRDVLTYAEAHGDPKRPYYYTIEAKQPGVLGYIAAEQIIAICRELGILDRVLLGSFYPDVSNFISRKYPNVARAADTLDVLHFVDAFLAGSDLRAVNSGYTVLVLPYEETMNAFFNFGSKEVVDYAHKYGVAVHYWTVNDPATAKMLSDYGADAIITDEPAAVYQALYK
jgi:glycerophosphoryl diester phosphodiesterase